MKLAGFALKHKCLYTSLLCAVISGFGIGITSYSLGGELDSDPLGRPPFHPLGPGVSLYSIGQPTDEEQLCLELINRSRADPSAEGVRLAATTDPNVRAAYTNFGVNLTQMQVEFSTNPAVAPLAMNAKLLAAARLHSGDMYTNQFEGLPGTDGSTPLVRINGQGYAGTNVGENVYASAQSAFHGHAELNVNWGSGPAGMITQRPQRRNIQSAGFREAGIGIVKGINGMVGPQLITEDFGSQTSAVPLVHGVVFYDFNGNNFYDLGEGIGGVTVEVTGSGYYAITANSGGYAVPVTSNGNYTVTFSATGLTNQQGAAVSSLKNVKRDYMPAYSPPVLSGPDPAAVNQANDYTFTPVGAAISYQCEQLELLPYNYVEGGENGLSNLTANISPDYSLFITDLKTAGSNSLHLCHPVAEDQILTVNAALRVATNSQLSFYKRLGWAKPSQVARAQVSTNSGVDWQDLWSQAGSDGEGDTNFAFIKVPLSSYASKIIQVRFVYDATSADIFPQTFSEAGLCLDNVAFLNCARTMNLITNNIPAGNVCGFYPTNVGSFLLRIRALLPGRTLDWGPALTLTVGPGSPAIRLLQPSMVSANQIQLDFNVSNFSPGMTFELWKAVDLTNWSNDTGAILQTLIPNSKYRLSTSTGGAPRTIYKVKGIY